MKRFKITIQLDNGNEVQSTVMARNQADARKRLETTQQYIDFVAGRQVEKIDIEPIPIEPIDNERFAVTTIDNKPGWYVVADLDNLVKIEWKKGMYNETQRVLPIGAGKELSALDGATAMREIGEYLYEHFKELL